MGAWIWVLPGQAVMGGMIAGRKIIVVTNTTQMRWNFLCKKTLRRMWPGIHQLVRIQ
jgi:hypothetical protein